MPLQVRAAHRRGKAGVGLTVNPASRISAKEWNLKIDASKNVDNYIKKQLTWKGDAFVISQKFKYPLDEAPDLWLQDWLTGIQSRDWELSTQHLEVVAKPSGPISVEMVPHLSKGEEVRYQLKETYSLDNLTLTLGWTFESKYSIGARLKSKKGLIIIATEVQLTMVGRRTTTTKTFTLTDDDLIRLWFHELALHVGRIIQDLPNTHEDIDGDTTVKLLESDINDMFPHSFTRDDNKQPISVVFNDVREAIVQFRARETGRR